MNQSKFIAILIICTAGLVFPVLPCSAGAQTAEKVRTDIDTAIEIQKKSQARRDEWETMKSALVSEYIRLTLESQALEQEHDTLVRQVAAQKEINRSLIRQKAESVRVLKELPRFLDTVLNQLDALVESDSPFLRQERMTRLDTLRRMLGDPSVTLSEKYRKIMEALFIEAEYGATIEVYQERISYGENRETLVNIFRLGRVSLFFLTLDREVCGVFNPALGRWQTLDPGYLPSIRSAVDTGSKRRPAELLDLPVGRLNPEGGKS
ncbi:MAG: DUF3450 domain-containing protein [Desulfobacterales bacterium]|nr:DUF3450 domain-containing protein [Desulfobacterales bacterium]